LNKGGGNLIKETVILDSAEKFSDDIKEAKNKKNEN
jgi:hypothetical protein